MVKTPKKIVESIKNADQIVESVIKGARYLIEISEPLLKNEKNKSILEPPLSDENYGIQTYLKRLENKVFRIGILGNQSCGKSFLDNTILRIPLLPVADLRTSGAKLQIIYGKHCYIDIKQDGIDKKTINCEETDEKTIKALKAFVCHCYKVIALKNIWYFLPSDTDPKDITPENAEKLEINANEPWQVAFLWMTLLTTYINQNAKREVLKDEWIRAILAREELYKDLGLDPEMDCDITLYLDNPFLACGISLVDLPGVGAAVNDTGKAKAHNQIATDAIRDTDAIIIATDKTITGGAVNDALIPILQCAQFKYAGARENRIIPLLTKVDQIKGRDIEQQVDTIKDTFITEILQPNKIMLTRDDIHCVSALNAEYIFCENLGIPYDRCLLISEDNGCNSLEDMKVRYEEASYIPEFSAFLQNYAVRGQIMISSELFAQCIVYAQKCIDILEGQLEDDLISLNFFKTFSENILECLTDIMSESFAETTSKILDPDGKSGIIDRYIKKLEGIQDTLKREANTQVRSAFINEIQEAKNDIMKKARSLPANLFGDVVLFRKDKQGQIVYEPTYYHCVSMIDDFSNTNYGSTQAAILQSMSNALKEIGKILSDMDEEVNDVYVDLNKEFNNLTQLVESRFKENGLNPNSLFVKTLTDRCRQIVEANVNIKNDLAFANSTQDLEQDFRTASLNIISSFISKMSDLAKDIEMKCMHKGFFKSKTTVLYYTTFVNQLDNEIKISALADNVCGNIVGEIDLLCNSFFADVNMNKSAPAIAPCINMQEMTAMMRDNLLINKGSDEEAIRGKLNQIWEQYCDFADKTNTTCSNMYSSFDDIRKDGGSFSVLVSEYIDKKNRIKNDLSKRVEKVLDNK